MSQRCPKSVRLVDTSHRDSAHLAVDVRHLFVLSTRVLNNRALLSCGILPSNCNGVRALDLVDNLNMAKSNSALDIKSMSKLVFLERQSLR